MAGLRKRIFPGRGMALAHSSGEGPIRVWNGIFAAGDWRAREMAAKTAFVLEGAHQGSNLGPADRFAPILLPKSFWGVE
ncbi:MAG TPA: hypothetical protein VI077_05510 [Pseudolabrys sp.]